MRKESEGKQSVALTVLSARTVRLLYFRLQLANLKLAGLEVLGWKLVS